MSFGYLYQGAQVLDRDGYCFLKIARFSTVLNAKNIIISSKKVLLALFDVTLTKKSISSLFLVRNKISAVV